MILQIGLGPIKSKVRNKAMSNNNLGLGFRGSR